ncbi:hypothetical protein ABZ590_25220, partial [Streptomyces hirsutus]
MDTGPLEAQGPASRQPLVEGDRSLDVVDADAQCGTQNLHGDEPSWGTELRARSVGYPGVMQRLEHMQHLDKHLVDELAQVARESVRDELREQAWGQRRKAALYGAEVREDDAPVRPEQDVGGLHIAVHDA